MGRPYITINCAMSVDGKIALPSRNQIRLSSEADIKRMYLLRHTNDAVLVGVGTVLTDNPKLTVKESYVQHPEHPMRVILDSTARTPPDALAVNDTAVTLLITKPGVEPKQEYGPNVSLISCKVDNEGFLDLHYVMKLLTERGIQNLLVEGGSTVIWNFLQRRLIDDFFVYISPVVIGGMHTPTVADGLGIKNEKDLIDLQIEKVYRLKPGLLIHYTLSS